MPRWTQTPEERFAAKVLVTDGCHLWTGATKGTESQRGEGYGAFYYDGKAGYAHRFALEQALGRPLKPGMQALHRCDTSLCVREDHLYEGTAKDNTADMIARGREYFYLRDGKGQS